MTMMTLLSSESTIQYIKDVFSVLAIPRGCEYRFRYDKQYIVRELLADFSDSKKMVGKKVLIAFRSANTASKENSFIIPIRWGTIKRINSITNGYTIDFIVEDYPNYTQEFRNACSSFSQLNQMGIQSLYSTDGMVDYAVWNGILPFVDPKSVSNPERDNEFWTQIVSAITMIPAYSQMLFIRCSNFYTETIDNENTVLSKECNKNERFYELVEGQCSYVDIDYYSKAYDKGINREIKAFIDDNIVSKAKGLRTVIESRYGKITIGFQPHKVQNRTISEIVFSSMSDKENELSTDITYPIIIIKDKTYKIKKSMMMILGAILVALPGIIGDALHILWNIGFAVSGAIVLGINTYLESKE